MNNKIILIGFMGSGKSTVAKVLGRRAGLETIEMDKLTLAASGRKNIPEIFEKDGEEHFRTLEAEVAHNLCDKTNCVIATGGGVGVNAEILKPLRENGIVIYLQAQFESILNRVGTVKNRPLLQNKEHAQGLFSTRDPLYKANADITIKTDGKTIEMIVREIIDRLN